MRSEGTISCHGCKEGRYKFQEEIFLKTCRDSRGLLERGHAFKNDFLQVVYNPDINHWMDRTEARSSHRLRLESIRHKWTNTLSRRLDAYPEGYRLSIAVRIQSRI